MLKYWKHLAAAFVACLVLVLLTQPAEAESERTSGAFTYKLKGNGTAAITGYDWNSMKGQDIFIPRMLDGYTVTEIADEAFALISYDSNDIPQNDYGYRSAGSLVIPDTVKAIGEKAFWGVNFSVSEISIPASVEYIGAGAFTETYIKAFVVDTDNPVYTTIDGVLYNKKTKTLVSYPSGRQVNNTGKVKGYYQYTYAYFTIPSGIKRIEDFAFFGVDLRGSFGIPTDASCIILPDTLETIGECAFAHAFATTNNQTFMKVELIFPASVQKIGTGAFYNCGATFKNFDMSAAAISEIPDYTFFKCKFYGDLKLPAHLTSIGNYAFYCSENSIGAVDYSIPATVTHIGNYAFAFFSDSYLVFPPGLFEFEAGSQLRSIGDSAFEGRTASKVTIPSQVETIGKRAFWGCGSTLVIPPSVTEIGEDIGNRSTVRLDTEPGSYAALYASENGFMTVRKENENTDWLTN